MNYFIQHQSEASQIQLFHDLLLSFAVIKLSETFSSIFEQKTIQKRPAKFNGRRIFCWKGTSTSTTNLLSRFYSRNTQNSHLTFCCNCRYLVELEKPFHNEFLHPLEVRISVFMKTNMFTPTRYCTKTVNNFSIYSVWGNLIFKVHLCIDQICKFIFN